jgi:photosystem II stability/assembly factor-like uncharacterized protein
VTGLRRRHAALGAAAATGLVLAVTLTLTSTGSSGQGAAITKATAKATATPASAGSAPVSEVESVSCVTASDCWAGASAGRYDVILASTDGGATWVVQDRVPGGSGIGPLDCPSSSHCWAGAGGPAASGETTRLLSTADGGASWTAKPLPSQAYGVERIACADDSHCWLVGAVPNDPADPDIVWATADGGASWAVQNTGSITDSMGASYGISCPSARRCVIVGIGDLTTDDGGRTWHRRVFPSGQPDSELQNIACPASDYCVAESDVTSAVPANESSAIATSTDAGATWQVRLAKVAGGVGVLAGLSCPTTRDCVSVGIGFSGDTAHGAVATSSDGGRTWATAALPEATNLFGVSCAPRSPDCVAVGWRETSTPSASDGEQTAGVIFRSADDGATWTPVPLPAITSRP